MKKKQLIIGVSLITASSIACGLLFGLHKMPKAMQANEYDVTATVSFNKANWRQSDFYDGKYEENTEATFYGGDKIRLWNVSPYDLTDSPAIAVIDKGEYHVEFFSELGQMYFQHVNSIEMTFTEDSNGLIEVSRNTNKHDYESTYIEVVNGVVTTPIDTADWRNFRFFADYGNSNPLYLTSLTVNYSCKNNYEDPVYAEEKYVTIMSSNDFHGYVKETDINLGLEKFGTYFKQRGEEDNTLLLDQGDSWQGTAYSNMNYGALVNNVMAYAGFDARTVGNHDFDWGVDRLIDNTARVFTYDHVDYTVPTLAANIYDYDFDAKEFGDIQQSDIGAATVTYTLENGLKVGIVGVIGEDQITSINSVFTHDIGFKPHIPIIKSEATKLREDENCDIVILSIHGDQDDVLHQGLENYVDLVLCGHTHQAEHTIENGLLYFQGKRNGECFGEIQLAYNTLTKKTYFDHFYYLYASDIKSELGSTVDPVIHDLVEDEIEKCDIEGQEILATGVVGTFETSGTGPNMVANAIYDYAKEVDNIDDLLLVQVNYTRSEIQSGTLTYADLYQALPFDNTVYVVEVTGREIYNRISQKDFLYRDTSFTTPIDIDGKYKVAILDYLFFHTDTSRYYDYFPDSNGHYIKTLSKNYREITKWWLKDYKHFDLEANTLSYSDYTNGLAQHSHSFNFNDCEITFHYNYEGAPDGGVYDVEYAPYRYSINSILPIDPTRANYGFDGWYLNPDCTMEKPSYVTGNMDLYAKWIDGTIYKSEELHWGTFENGAETTTVSATNILSQGINIEVDHSDLARNATYDEFTFQPNGVDYLCLDLSDYIVTHVKIKSYSTYDNLSFYRATTADEDNILKDAEENRTQGDGSDSNCLIYSIDVNSSQFYITNLSTYNTHVYYIQITVQAI